MPNYLNASDVTDKLIKPVITSNASDYLVRADKALTNLALRCGADITLMPTGTLLPYEVKEFLLAKIGFDVCADNSGKNMEAQNSQGIFEDPYTEKLKFYSRELKNITGSINKEIIEGVADTPKEFGNNSFSLGRA